jgi:5-methylcytosine-specific restriction protein A
VWAGAEAALAQEATECTPSELRSWGAELIEKLDADGPEPDDGPPAEVNELHLLPHRGRPGGSLKGRFDSADLYDAIATLIDTMAAPRTSDDQRTAAQRQAEALAQVCGHVLDHGDVPESGGHRPHLNVIIGLEDLEGRARAAMLDFGGRLSPEALRLLACDAAVVPIVMNGAGQPLDVGRARRTIPDGLRRAVAARDRGCARCGRPPSWCEIHHIIEWEIGGETELGNCVMLCRTCHRLIHHTDWIVRLRDGLPEFIPPAWIDPDRHPRRRPQAHLVPA